MCLDPVRLNRTNLRNQLHCGYLYGCGIGGVGRIIGTVAGAAAIGIGNTTFEYLPTPLWERYLYFLRLFSFFNGSLRVL